MFRKALLAFAAFAVVGTAAFTITGTTSASADAWRNHRNHQSHWRPAIRFSTPGYHAYGSCVVRRVVHTPFGPRVHYVNVC